MTPHARRHLDATLAALADPIRRGIVDLLREKPRPAGELARAFAMSPPAMSRHLRLLRQRGLVEEQRHAEDARLRVYRLRRAEFKRLHRWLSEVDRFWTDQLASFKAQTERNHGR